MAWIGQNGLDFAAALSGLVNVDAISLTVATMVAQGRAGVRYAVKAVSAAASVNTSRATVHVRGDGRSGDRRGESRWWCGGVSIQALTAFFAMA